MRKKCFFVAGLLGLILIIGMGLTSLYVSKTQNREKQKNITVVTSFYPMYIATENIIGETDHVKLKNLSEPQTGCLHDFQLTPEDMKLLSTADIFVINGGGIESFMQKVAQAYPELSIVRANQDETLLADGDEVNAHAWMSVSYYRGMVEKIAKGLAEADTENADVYLKNAREYDKKLETLKKEQESIKKGTSGKSVILFHEAYDYVAEDYGLTVEYVLDMDEERPVSAGEISDVLNAVKNHDVKVIFAEKRYGKNVAETIQKETDVEVIYLDSLNRGDYDKDSYIVGMQKNMEKLKQYFSKAE